MKLEQLVTVVGCHAEGEVGRVITGGVLPPPGDSVFAQMQWLQKDDSLRKRLLYEPRGGAFVHANLVLPPIEPRADAVEVRVGDERHRALQQHRAVLAHERRDPLGLLLRHGPRRPLLAAHAPRGVRRVPT